METKEVPVRTGDKMTGIYIKGATKTASLDLLLEAALKDQGPGYGARNLTFTEI